MTSRLQAFLSRLVVDEPASERTAPDPPDPLGLAALALVLCVFAAIAIMVASELLERRTAALPQGLTVTAPCGPPLEGEVLLIVVQAHAPTGCLFVGGRR